MEADDRDEPCAEASYVENAVARKVDLFYDGGWSMYGVGGHLAW